MIISIKEVVVEVNEMFKVIKIVKTIHYVSPLSLCISHRFGMKQGRMGKVFILLIPSEVPICLFIKKQMTF
jgi:hypothetical protein